MEDQAYKNLQALKLRHLAKKFKEDIEKLPGSERDKISELVEVWTNTEISEKNSELITRRTAAAKFLRIQTIEDYNFDYNKSTKALKEPYIKIHGQVREGKVPKAVFVGNTGLGKTHLSKALGLAVCQSGRSTLFTKASSIVNSLAAAKATHALENELKRYRRPDLLIIDELGYVTMDLEAGNLFFQVISDRHERGLGTIVTTNFAFGQWNQIFASESTAVVIVERLTAEAEVFYLEGESYPQHLKKQKMAKKA
jgi:DNA replication protein DnaC